jgi:hypothetical protein
MADIMEENEPLDPRKWRQVKRLVRRALTVSMSCRNPNVNQPRTRLFHFPAGCPKHDNLLKYELHKSAALNALV